MTEVIFWFQVVAYGLGAILMLALIITQVREHYRGEKDGPQVEFSYIDRTDPKHPFKLVAFFEEVTPDHRKAMRSEFLAYFRKTQQIRGEK